MLKLKLQYFGHMMQIAGSFEKTLMLVKIEGGRKRGLEPSYTVSGNANWYSHYGEQCGGSLNLLNRTAIRPSKPTAGQTH